MRKIIWVNGLVGGAITISLFFIGNAMSPVENCEYDKSMLMTYAAMIVGLSSIFFGIKTYRDKHLGGSISFGRAFLIGLYINLIASAIYVIGWKIFSNILMPHHMEDYAYCQVETLKKAGASAKAIADEQAKMDNMLSMMKNPFIEIPLIFFTEIFPVGLFISLLCAAILKRQPNAAKA